MESLPDPTPLDERHSLRFLIRSGRLTRQAGEMAEPAACEPDELLEGIDPFGVAQDPDQGNPADE